MQRHPEALDSAVDVLIIGGGVHGVALARTLARSGVGVALVERGDFGAETTRNSLKIVHGGLRYIQHLDVSRIRESVRAQRAWLSAAPHLVRPLRFTIPTKGWGTRGPVALAVGTTFYDLLAGNRNRGLRADVRLLRSGVGGGDGFRRSFPEVDSRGVNGRASWFDAQIRDAGRLITECVADAAAAGALVLNHVEALALLKSERAVGGALVRDRLSGREYELKARVTVATAGPWTAALMRDSGLEPSESTSVAWTRNVNIVLKQRVVAGGAVGLFSRRQSDGVIGRAARLYFVTPWQDTSIVGTAHELCTAAPDSLSISVAELESLLGEFNSALSGRVLTIDDVAYVHMGLTPSEEAGANRAKRTLICDYERESGVGGYLEVIANKLTTAPTVATKVARRVLGKLGVERALPDFAAPLPNVPDGPDPVAAASEAAEGNGGELAWTRAVLGRSAERVCRLAEAHPDVDVPTRLFRARVVHGVREEMVVRLGDALFRCTDLAERGRLAAKELAWCAGLMATEFGWSEDRRAEELGDVAARLTRHMSGGPAKSWSGIAHQRMKSVGGSDRTEGGRMTL